MLVSNGYSCLIMLMAIIWFLVFGIIRMMVMHGYKWILISSHWDFNHLIWGFAISPLNSSLLVATCSVSG